MKLDLMYEIDAPRPWDAGEHPDGQRAREQRAHYEMLDQVKLADQLGFNVAWFVEHHFGEGPAAPLLLRLTPVDACRTPLVRRLRLVRVCAPRTAGMGAWQAGQSACA